VVNVKVTFDTGFVTRILWSSARSR